MTQTALGLWKRLGRSGPGRWLYAHLICLRAPYFSTIKPLILELASGRCVVRISDRRAVHNHIGTVHAIALCNLAELSAGLATDASVRLDQRWIPKAMTVNYLKKAQGTLTAVATITGVDELKHAAEILAFVEVSNQLKEIVFTAQVSMWISDKRA